MKNKIKIYEREFKIKTVLLSYQRKPLVKLEKELGLASGTLSKWRQDYEIFGTQSFPGCGNLRSTLEQKRIFKLEKDIKDSEAKFYMIKNTNSYLGARRPMIFRFIESHDKIYSVRQMCEVLGVGACTYRRWKNKIISEPQKQKSLMKKEITTVFFAAKQRYGITRVTAELQYKGFQISRSTVGRYMKELSLKSIK